jgi:hypothetical protein
MSSNNLTTICTHADQSNSAHLANGGRSTPNVYRGCKAKSFPDDLKCDIAGVVRAFPGVRAASRRLARCGTVRGVWLFAELWRSRPSARRSYTADPEIRRGRATAGARWCATRHLIRTEPVPVVWGRRHRRDNWPALDSSEAAFFIPGRAVPAHSTQRVESEALTRRIHGCHRSPAPRPLRSRSRAIRCAG